MKIALVTDGISPYVIGGMQRHSASLGVELVKLGHSVDLYHFVLKGNSIPTTDEVNRFHFNSTNGFNKTYCLYFPTSIRFPGHYLWNSYKYSKWVFKKISYQKDEYDFIYAKGFSGWETLKKRNKLTFKSKIGIKFHGYEMFQYAPNLKIKLQHFMLRPFVRMINNRADYVFSYGGKITNIIKGLGVTNDKIIEIPTAINKSWLYDNKLNISKSIKFLFVGRIERRKGIEEINKAILSLPINNLDIEFHFVGPIPAINQIKSNDLKIIYYGEIIDEKSKKKIYDKCDILMCPSYSEGMPNVILEAMSRGLAIMATDVGAVRLLVSSDNGILIKNCSEKLIQKAIIKINSMNKDLILDMKYLSVNKIKKSFLWNDVIKKIVVSIQKNI